MSEELLPLAGAGAAALLPAMVGVWLLSLRLRDASIVDRVWGLCFVVQAWTYALVSGTQAPLPWLVVLLVTVWGVRLSAHIHLRNRGHAEDYRYARMREEHGGRFWWYSLFSVFLLQGVISLLVGAPLLWTIAGAQPVNGMAWVVAGVLLWLAGFFFEAVGDWQLTRFKADPDNRGKLLTTGLWSLTRHPNYFGDAALWWGFYLIAVSVDGGWMSVFGPAIMSFFIRFVSGVAMLEKDQIKKYPEYADYIRTTPTFMPSLLVPRGVKRS
jgi:steroid 5-alpha reductase family enzyme